MPVDRQNVIVSLRVRPLLESEYLQQNSIWVTDTQSIQLSKEAAFRLKKPVSSNRYDHVFEGSDNFEVYSNSVKPIVHSAVEGLNGTIFAYGQTSSGKTFTMMGDESNPGIIVQSITEVFDYISKCADKEFLLRVSYLEIYNEGIHDLLNPESKDLKIHEDKSKCVYVSPLKEEIVTSIKQVMKAIQVGERNRHTSTTDYNEHSSRSHTIFQMVIESKVKQNIEGVGRIKSEPVKVSILNLIDLAGSEKASADQDRKKEGAYINKSLLTLATVISKLTESSTPLHIPYRDSKLTRLLQPSLSGNAKISVICTLSPSINNFEESLNTCKFASRVKQVITNPAIQTVVDEKALLKKYEQEINDLKLKLANSSIEKEREMIEERNNLVEEKQRYQEELREQHLIRTALKERIDHLTKLIITSSSTKPKQLDFGKRNHSIYVESKNAKSQEGFMNGGLSNAVEGLDMKNLQVAQKLQKDLELQLKEKTIEIISLKQELAESQVKIKELQAMLEEEKQSSSQRILCLEAELDVCKKELKLYQ